MLVYDEFQQKWYNISYIIRYFTKFENSYKIYLVNDIDFWDMKTRNKICNLNEHQEIVTNLVICLLFNINHYSFNRNGSKSQMKINLPHALLIRQLNYGVIINVN